MYTRTSSLLVKKMGRVAYTMMAKAGLTHTQTSVFGKCTVFPPRVSHSWIRPGHRPAAQKDTALLFLCMWSLHISKSLRTYQCTWIAGVVSGAQEQFSLIWKCPHQSKWCHSCFMPDIQEKAVCCKAISGLFCHMQRQERFTTQKFSGTQNGSFSWSSFRF